MRIFKEEKLLIATRNPGKRALLESCLKPYNIPLVMGEDIDIADPEETGTTFEENAFIKATAYCQASGLVTLSDDSGLVVPALDGAPGVYSARFSAENGGYMGAFKKLETMLEGKDPKAVFVCALVLMWPDGHYEKTQGEVWGRLTFPPRIGRGFGYYPVFIPEDETRTFSQMTEEEMSVYNHRVRSFESFKPIFDGTKQENKS